MDKMIRALPAKEDNDLMLCLDYGIAYQKDMSQKVSYDKEYFEKCLGYEGNDISNKIHKGRVKLVDKYYDGTVLDVGVGSGEFVRHRRNTYGYDINPIAIWWLKSKNLYSDDFTKYGAFTFWDVLEHIENPASMFKKMRDDAYVFVSLPIFDDLKNIRESRHYRPNEHLYYWTEQGFIGWMGYYKFHVLEVNNHETEAGREDIKSFAFLRHA